MNKIPATIALTIRNLRRRGRSIPEISKELKLPKSTIFRYVQEVSILPRYRRRWLERRNASRVISERNWDLARQRARQLINPITDKGLALVVASLYWAEGSKKDFSFRNSDPNMVRLFIKILREIFQVKNEDISISLRTYEDLNQNACLRYWSKMVGKKLDQRTSFEILQGSKKGKLKYGMCRVRIRRGGLLLKQFSVIIRSIIDHFSPRSSMERTSHS